MKRGWTIAVAILFCACARNHVDTDLRGAVVRIEPDSVTVVRTPEFVKFTVNVIVRNDRATPLYFGGCGPEAQEEINGSWKTVWSPICVSPSGGSLAPRDSLTFPFTAIGYFNRRIEPTLDPAATAGRYRIRMGATYEGPLEYGVVRLGGPEPKPVTLRALTSPVFFVYWP